MQQELVLVTGGSRSGKSEFAERYVLENSGKCAYIATAEILDEEMAQRVRLHRERRNTNRWINYEAPYHAEKIFTELTADVNAVLFDCLTIYLANLLYGKESLSGSLYERTQFVAKSIDNLLAAAKDCQRCVVFVTNEVGSGLVPETKMGREYRDISGWINQRVAAACDKVFFCVAGQAVDVKKLAYKFASEE